MKAMKIVLGALLAVSVVAVIAFQVFFRAAVPDVEGTLNLEGLKATVEVRTDDYGVPHIYAQNETDLFFAQGYVMARERMFQMDMTRLATRGELSTLFGEVTLEKDRFLKTIGLHRQARNSYPKLSAEARQVLTAFARGVNAYINGADPLPREYFFLGATPQPWEPEDSVATLLLMSYSLTRSKKVDLVLHNIRKAAGDDFLKLIIPSYPDFAPTLSGKRLRSVRPPISENPSVSAVQARPEPTIPDLPYLPDIAASNWMIFSGRMTTSGKAMFAGSPDLSPTLPALFYLMHIKGGNIDAIGGALPGMPTLGPLGFNGYFAFSAVNGRGDELDYFVEKINPDNPDQYLTENGYRNFQIINETLRIKTDDGFRSEPMKIRVSRHGPIISEVLPDAPPHCAMQWAALEIVNRDIEGLLAVVKARSFEEFRQGAGLIRSVNLNLGYADTDGNIGWQFTACPPIRKKGDGSLVVPGWNGDYDWQGFVPFAKVPYDLNPKRGYVASFNNEPGNVDYHLTNYYLFERAMRFEEIMHNRPKGPVDFKELKAMQLDTVSVVAQRWSPLIISACRSEQNLDRYLDLLRNWDHNINTESNAAAVFNYFYYRMMKNTLVDEVGSDLWDKGLGREYLYYVPDLLLTKIRNEENHPIFDDTSTSNAIENRDDIIRRSMTETVEFLTKTFGDDINDWKWMEVHKMPFKHPLGSKLFFLNLAPIPTPGSHHTINSGFWNPKNPFEMSSGGVIRMMVDFADIDGATFISPPGQSGHYLSPYYDDLVEMWAAGNQIPMHYTTGKTLPQLLTLAPK